MKIEVVRACDDFGLYVDGAFKRAGSSFDGELLVYFLKELGLLKDVEYLERDIVKREQRHLDMNNGHWPDRI